MYLCVYYLVYLVARWLINWDNECNCVYLSVYLCICVFVCLQFGIVGGEMVN